jgi:hypothetical protein
VVARGLALAGYVGALSSWKLAPAKGKVNVTAWLALVETPPMGLEGSPAAKPGAKRVPVQLEFGQETFIGAKSMVRSALHGRHADSVNQRPLRDRLADRRSANWRCRSPLATPHPERLRLSSSNER